MPPSRQPHSPHRIEGFGNRDIDLSYDPRDMEPVTPYTHELKDEYEEAQHQLVELRQREEMVRRQAEELEELAYKEEEFTRGRLEMIEQIEEYLDLLDREAAEARHMAAECQDAQQRFHHHLNTVRNLRPEAWKREERIVELDRALRQIEDAESELTHRLPLLEHVRGQSPRVKSDFGERGDPVGGSAPFQSDFLFWLKAGIAFTLPLMTLLVVISILLFYLK